MRILNWNTHPNNEETLKALDMFDDLDPDVITLQEVSAEFFDELDLYSRDRSLHIDRTLDWVRKGVPYYLVTMLSSSASSQSIPYGIRRNGLVARSIGWQETLNFSVSTSEHQTVLNGHLEHHAGPRTRRKQLNEMLSYLSKGTNVMGVDLNQWFPFEKGRNARLLKKYNLTDIVKGGTMGNGLCLDGIIVSEDLAHREYDFEKQSKHGSDHYPLFVEFHD